MARTKRETDSSSSPKKKADETEATAAWRAFYAKESARIRAENPSIKGGAIMKKCSAAYKKQKQENNREANEQAPSSEMGEESQAA